MPGLWPEQWGRLAPSKLSTFAQKLPVANTRVRCAKILIYFEIY